MPHRGHQSGPGKCAESQPAIQLEADIDTNGPMEPCMARFCGPALSLSILENYTNECNLTSRADEKGFGKCMSPDIRGLHLPVPGRPFGIGIPRHDVKPSTVQWMPIPYSGAGVDCAALQGVGSVSYLRQVSNLQPSSRTFAIIHFYT